MTAINTALGSNRGCWRCSQASLSDPIHPNWLGWIESSCQKTWVVADILFTSWKQKWLEGWDGTRRFWWVTFTSERCPSKARAFVKIDGSHLGPAGLVPSFIHPWPDHQLLAYGSSVCLMLINRANNIFEIDWRWCRARQPWPWQLALQPSFDFLSVTPQTLLCCYNCPLPSFLLLLYHYMVLIA
jgi:hypothetical protein